MPGDLITQYEEIAREQEWSFGNKPDLIQAGLTAMLRRIERSIDADAAAVRESLEASEESESDEARAAIAIGVQRGLPLCESPIEKLLLPWLLAQKYPRFEYGPRLLIEGEEGSLPDLHVAVVPQMHIGKYRADFALAARRGRNLKFVVVECDGKNFHSSKRQIARDGRRDSYLMSQHQVLGVVRFTGSEIYRSPKDCAAKAARLLYRRWLKGNPETDHKFSEASR